MASAAQSPRPVSPSFALGLPMRREPFPGQKKPPCDAEMLQKTINGGCWVGPGTKKPPCGPEAFDYDGGCYTPIFKLPHSPTSEDPR